MTTHSFLATYPALQGLKSSLRTLLGIHANSPEFKVLETSLERGNTKVSAVALEVLASHFRDGLNASDRLVLHVLATALRMGEWDVIDSLFGSADDHSLLNLAA